MNWSLYVASSAALLMLNVGAFAQVNVAKKSASRDTRFDTLRPENTFSDWRRLAIEGGSRVGEAGIGYAQISPGDPLSANGAETTSGFWLPLSERLSSLVEASVVPGAFGGADRSVLDTLAGAEPDPAGAVQEHETRRQLWQAIDQLGERDRLVVRLYYLEDRTLAEIGRILGVTESRVCQLHARLIARLRACLAEAAR